MEGLRAHENAMICITISVQPLKYKDARGLRTLEHAVRLQQPLTLTALCILGAAMGPIFDTDGTDVAWSAASMADCITSQRAERARLLASIHDASEDLAKAGGPLRLPPHP